MVTTINPTNPDIGWCVDRIDAYTQPSQFLRKLIQQSTIQQTAIAYQRNIEAKLSCLIDDGHEHLGMKQWLATSKI
jgi:hypothetical protein